MNWQGAWLGNWAGRGGTYADAAAVLSGGGQLVGDLHALGAAPLPAHTSGGGGGVQLAQRRRLRERAQEEEEIAMVLTVLAQIGVFA